MAAQTISAEGDQLTAVNEVRLVGRLATVAETKELPSGDTLVSFRLVVARAHPAARRQSVDTLEGVVWAGRAKRSVLSWREGDVVEVTGALRRRFFRTGAGTASRAEVEVATGRLVRRAKT